MSKLTKLNFAQKQILGEFMANHTDLAKSLLPNTCQGKARANQLWEHLATKLNASGPPIKDAKMWRKVYADQKQMVKRKVAFNKSSKKRTGGGPYEEKVLSFAEEQILAAAGIEVAVEGLSNVQSFGSVQKECPQTNNLNASLENNDDLPCSSPCAVLDTEESQIHCIYSSLIGTGEEKNSLMETDENVEEENSQATKKKRKVLPKISQRTKESKTTLLQQNITSTESYHTEMLQKFDTLIEINKRNLELKEKEVEVATQLLLIKKKALDMKERKQELQMQIKAMELQIRRKELEQLNMNI